MARAGIDEYLYLLDAAFAGSDWHSLLTNVRAVVADDDVSHRQSLLTRPSAQRTALRSAAATRRGARRRAGPVSAVRQVG